MGLGAFRLNSIAKRQGAQPDFFKAYTHRQSLFTTASINNLEFLGFNTANPKDVFITSGWTRPSIDRTYLSTFHITGSAIANETLDSVASGQIEVIDAAVDNIPCIIASPSTGVNSPVTADIIYFSIAYQKNGKIYIRTFKGNFTSSFNIQFNDRGPDDLESIVWESTNDRYDFSFTSTGATTGVLFARSNNSGNHKTVLLSNLHSSTSPTQYTVTESNVPYDDNTRYKVLGLADGGCGYRGVYMGSGTEPFASFFSYNGTTRTTSNATQISKTDDADSVPLICKIAADKIVFGIYAPSTDKMYLRAASHSWGGSCATGTTTTGAEIEIDAQDGGNIIDGFVDNKFYVVQYSNSEATVKIRTFTVDGTTITEIGAGNTFTDYNGSNKPNTNVYQNNGITKINYSDTKKYIGTQYIGHNNYNYWRKFQLIS